MDDGYHELAIADLRSQTELNEVATDAGRQLAGYFWTTFPEPLRRHQRFGQLRAFEMTETRARTLVRELAEETVAGWQQFRRQPSRCKATRTDDIRPEDYMKDATTHTIELESDKIRFLEEMVGIYSLPDIGKAIRCLINYAREQTDKQAEIFGEVRCLDC